MERNSSFPQKVSEDMSGTRINFIERKGEKKGTLGSKNKNSQKIDISNSNSSLANVKSKKEREKISSSSSRNKSLLIMEEIDEERIKKSPKKNETKKEGRYIVENMEDIFSKVSSEKLKLIIQEAILYFIVFMVCMYHWMFLFISRNKLEQNFCYINGQFDACSENQICKDYSSKMNIILFNHTLNIKNQKGYDSFDFFLEESKLINKYYKPFFAYYIDNLSRDKALSKLQIMHNSQEMINYVVVLSYKEKWNLFYRNYNLCEASNYFAMFVVMVALGGIIGSLAFGFLSDIFGRRNIIRVTLLIITIMTLFFSAVSFGLDKYSENQYDKFDDLEEFKNLTLNNSNMRRIIKELYVQEKVRNLFKDIFFVFCIIIFTLSAGLWPLLKSCMALLIENSKGELNVLIGFRRYNFFFGGIPAFFTSLIFANVNNFTLTFSILGIINLILFIISMTFLEESIRYYYEYCEWPRLTETILKIYKVNLDDFKTLNEEELKQFRKEENIKNFTSSLQKGNYFLENNIDNSIIFQNSYYNLYKDKNNALKRNLKRDTDFIIRSSNVRSNPYIIIICLLSNRTFNNSKLLILIVLILLYLTMNLLQKEFLEMPFFTMNDLYINLDNNYLLNSVFFLLAITNCLSNLFFYGLYRINCFKTVIYISIVFNIFALFTYHLISNTDNLTPIYFNQYNQRMIEEFNKEKMSIYYIVLLLAIYFLLNGANFYVYLLILKISKTIYRCTYFSIHSIALIFAFILTECFHLLLSHYFLCLSVLNILCFFTFIFLSEFKELLYVVNDLKIDIHRPSKNLLNKKKND